MVIWRCPTCGTEAEIAAPSARPICARCGAVLGAAGAGARAAGEVGPPASLAAWDAPPRPKRATARRLLAAAGSLALIAFGVWILGAAHERWLFDEHRLDDPKSAAVALTHASPQVRAFARTALRTLLHAQRGADAGRAFSSSRIGRQALAVGAPFLARAAAGVDLESAALAADWLRELGGEAAPALGRTLASPDPPAMRRAAGRALLLLDGKAAPAQEALLAVAASEADPVCGLALEALCRIHGVDFGALGPPAHRDLASALRAAGPPRRAALDLLRLLEESGDPLVRDHADVALPALLSAVPAGRDGPGGALAEMARRLAGGSESRLAAALTHEDPVVRANAARLLAEGPVHPSTVERLLAAMGDTDEWVRGWARIALARAAKRPPGTTVAFARGLGDTSPWVREASARAAGYGPLYAQLLPGLVEALADRETDVRRAAASVLARVAELPEGSIGAVTECAYRLRAQLATALEDESATVRAQAVRALSWIGSRAAPFVPALAKTLGDPDESVRLAVARALGSLGASAESALERILEALPGETDPVRIALVRAVQRVGQSDARMPALLLGCLEDRVEAVRTAAADALAASGSLAVAVLRPALATAAVTGRRKLLLGILARIGPDARAALPEILTAMKDADHPTRKAAIRAAGALGLEGGDAAPALLGLIRNRDAAAQEAGVALGAILPAADSLLPESLDLLRSLVDPVAKNALRTALAAIPEQSVPAVARWLEGDAASRQEAMETLAAIGHATDAAEPLLLGPLEDPDPRVRADFARIVAGCWDGDRQIAALVRLGVMMESDPVIEVRIAALEASLGVHAHDADRDARLIRLAVDPEVRIRRVAVGGLGGGTAATAAAQVAALRDPAEEVALAARIGLSTGAFDFIRRPLLILLADSQPRLRAEAAELLARDPKSSERVAAVLSALLQARDDAPLRRRAAAVFARAPALVRHALPALRAAREDADEEVRRVATEVLAKRGGR